MVVLDRNGTMSSNQSHVTTEKQYSALMGMISGGESEKKTISSG